MRPIRKELAENNLYDAVCKPAAQGVGQKINHLRKRVLFEGEYPNKQDLASMGLDFAPFLVASGLAVAIPGGAGSSFAPSLVERALDKYRGRLIDGRGVTIVGVTHGTDLPEANVYDPTSHPDFRRIALETHQPLSASWVNHYRREYAEMLCGASGGSMTALREAVVQNAQRIRELPALRKASVETVMIEAQVGRRTPGMSLIRGVNYDNDPQALDYVVNGEKAPYGSDPINTVLREAADKGNVVILNSCVDPRAGTVFPSASRGSISLDGLVSIYNPDRNPNGMFVGRGALGHADTPYGAVVDPKDLGSFAIARDLLVNPSALLRNVHNYSSVSASYPLILSGVSAEFLMTEEGAQFTAQVQRLVGNLDREVYARRNLATGLKDQVNTRWWKLTEAGLREIVDYKPGLNLILPYSDLGYMLSQVEIKRPLAIEPNGQFHPNPEATLHYPGSRQLGSVRPHH